MLWEGYCRKQLPGKASSGWWEKEEVYRKMKVWEKALAAEWKRLVIIYQAAVTERGCCCLGNKDRISALESWEPASEDADSQMVIHYRLIVCEEDKNVTAISGPTMMPLRIPMTGKTQVVFKHWVKTWNEITQGF